MKQFFLLFFAFVLLQCSAQKHEKFNLGFENKKDGQALSEGWFKWGTYPLHIDSLSHSGKYAGKITSTEAGDAFGSITYRIPAKYIGSKIKHCRCARYTCQPVRSYQ